MKNWIFERLSEASTWRGIVALLTALGITISPDQATAVTAGGLAIIGAVGAFFSDKK